LSVPPASAAPAADVLPLLADGALRLEAAPELLPLVRRWLPLLPYADTASAYDGAVIRVVADDPARLAAPSAAPVLRLGAADVWVDDDAGTARLRCTGGSAGEADLARGSATLVPAPGDRAADGVVAWDLFSMCTLASALLLGRMHRSLVHAAGIVAPDGGAWLLAGDARAGKSTTSVNLISAGWRFVSDDNVVLFRGADGAVWVEGWPRRFHLDEGWEAGTPLHRRGEVDPHERWPGQWLRTAPLAGMLFPRVAAELPTELAPFPAPDALAALMRQSPWLLADRACAAEVLAFLRSACERPAFSLRLGLDSYRDTDRLLNALAPLWG
jgi:hypothetical protein